MRSQGRVAGTNVRWIAVLFVALALAAVSLWAAGTTTSAQSPETDPVEEATLVQVGLEGELAGELTVESGGEDLYRFEAVAGTHYIIEVKAELLFLPAGRGSPTLVQPHLLDPSILRIEDSEGTEVLGERDQGGFTLNWARAFFTPAADGTYTVAVGTGSEGRGGFGRYTISVRADDHADDVSTDPAETLRPGESIGAVIDSDVAPDDPRLHWWDWATSPEGVPIADPSQLRPRRGIEMADDRDVFRFAIARTGDYTLSIVDDRAGATGIWYIWDASANFVAMPEGGFAQSLLHRYTPGTYFVEVGTPYESSGNTGNYSLSLSDPPLDEVTDCSATTLTTCTLPVGEPKTGRIDAPSPDDGESDVDVWAMDLEGGRVYVIEVKGAGDVSGGNDNGGSLPDPFARLSLAGDLFLEDNDDVSPSNRNARTSISVPPGVNLTLFLHVSGKEGVAANTGTYTVSVTAVD